MKKTGKIVAVLSREAVEHMGKVLDGFPAEENFYLILSPDEALNLVPSSECERTESQKPKANA